MATGVLYTYGGNFRAIKALVAAGFSGANVTVDSNFSFGTTNKTEEFLKKFPFGKVPAFESADGKVLLSESDAIAYYLATDALRGGSNEVARAEVLRWIVYAQAELFGPIAGWLFPSMSIMAFNKVQVAKSKSETERQLSILNDILLTRTYLVGESITLADIAIFATLIDLVKQLLDKPSREQYPNLTRWFDTILNQTQVQQALTKASYEFSYNVTPLQFDNAKFQQLSGGQPQAKKDDKKKEKKEEKPKKEAPKKKEAEPTEEPDAAEMALAEEPKSKDPLDALPKGTWVMDDFKRYYSNNDTDKSIPYFWEHFDPENYSIWFGEYKYNEELAKVFMSCNLITGMFQRLDKLRKNAFASVCLFGEDNNSTISGLWIWRGQELAFPLSPDWQIDYETYSWKKLDPAAPETRKMVEDYFAWTGTDSTGRKFNQGKIFK